MLRALLAFSLLTATALAAQDENLEVDVELFLAVDVSRSMSPFELEIQRRGYAAALGSSAVKDAIGGGMIGRIALTYVEWAGHGSQTVIIPWTLIDTHEQADAIAKQLTVIFNYGMRRTSISGALDFAVESFDLNEFTGLRRVIDISGDGPNNHGLPVTGARDAALTRGITINGLPLMTEDEFSSRWGIPDLDVYYRECVIGGPGSFVLPVFNWDQFARAVQRKLVLEIAGDPPPPAARIVPASGYDCLIGEKLWQRNQRDFSLP